MGTPSVRIAFLILVTSGRVSMPGPVCTPTLFTTQSGRKPIGLPFSRTLRLPKPFPRPPPGFVVLLQTLAEPRPSRGAFPWGPRARREVSPAVRPGWNRRRNAGHILELKSGLRRPPEPAWAHGYRLPVPRSIHTAYRSYLPVLPAT